LRSRHTVRILTALKSTALGKRLPHWQMGCETRERYELDKDATDSLVLMYDVGSYESQILLAMSAELRNKIDAHQKDCPICRGA
jgi:hypothetical protein